MCCQTVECPERKFDCGPIVTMALVRFKIHPGLTSSSNVFARIRGLEPFTKNVPWATISPPPHNPYFCGGIHLRYFVCCALVDEKT
jgi:hypothetical protein